MYNACMGSSFRQNDDRSVGTQPELGVVGECNALVLGLERENGHDRSEQFHLGAANRLVVTADDGRLEVPARVQSLGPLTTGVDGCTLGSRFGEDSLDPVPLGLGCQGSHLGVLVERVTNPDGLGAPDHLCNELIVGASLDEHP